MYILKIYTLFTITFRTERPGPTFVTIFREDADNRGNVQIMGEIRYTEFILGKAFQEVLKIDE